MRRIGAGAVFKAAIAVALGCGSGTVAPDDSVVPERDLRIAAVSGDHQVGEVGTTLPVFLVARVTHGAVLPVEDVRVRWEAVQGQGELSLKGSFTDRQGLAAAVLFLGDEPGELIVRVFLDNGEETRFTARAVDLGAPAASVSPAFRGR